MLMHVPAVIDLSLSARRQLQGVLPSEETSPQTCCISCVKLQNGQVLFRADRRCSSRDHNIANWLLQVSDYPGALVVLAEGIASTLHADEQAMLRSQSATLQTAAGAARQHYGKQARDQKTLLH